MAQPVVVEDISASQSSSNSANAVSSSRPPGTSCAVAAPPVSRSEPSACWTAGGCPAAGARRHDIGSCTASSRLRKQCDAPES